MPCGISRRCVAALEAGTSLLLSATSILQSRDELVEYLASRVPAARAIKSVERTSSAVEDLRCSPHLILGPSELTLSMPLLLWGLVRSGAAWDVAEARQRLVAIAPWTLQLHAPLRSRHSVGELVETRTLVDLDEFPDDLPLWPDLNTASIAAYLEESALQRGGAMAG